MHNATVFSAVACDLSITGSTVPPSATLLFQGLFGKTGQ